MATGLKFHIAIEQAEGNLSAYVLELPGCVATGKDQAELRRNMELALKRHLDGMREDGDSIPQPIQVDTMAVPT